MKPDPTQLRQMLSRASVMLVFTPELAGDDPYAALSAALPHVDCVQVRPKSLDDPRAVTSAREAYDASLQVLDRVAAAGLEVPVLVNDRVDVAAAAAELKGPCASDY